MLFLQGFNTFSNSDKEEDTYEFTEDLSGGVNFSADGFGTNFSTGSSNEGTDFVDSEHIKKVNSMEDILVMDLKGLSPHLVRKVDFVSLEMAYEFHNWYGRQNGFSVRKGKILYSNTGLILQRDFVCHRQ